MVLRWAVKIKNQKKIQQIGILPRQQIIILHNFFCLFVCFLFFLLSIFNHEIMSVPEMSKAKFLIPQKYLSNCRVNVKTDVLLTLYRILSKYRWLSSNFRSQIDYSELTPKAGLVQSHASDFCPKHFPLPFFLCHMLSFEKLYLIQSCEYANPPLTALNNICGNVRIYFGSKFNRFQLVVIMVSCCGFVVVWDSMVTGSG